LEINKKTLNESFYEYNDLIYLQHSTFDNRLLSKTNELIDDLRVITNNSYSAW